MVERHALRRHAARTKSSPSTPPPAGKNGSSIPASPAAAPTAPLVYWTAGSDRAHLRRRAELRLRPRRANRRAHRRLRQRRPHRSARRTRPRSRHAIHGPSPVPASFTRICSLSAAAIPKRCPRRPATFAPTTSAPASCAGPSTPSRIPANSATTPGPKTPGNTPARPTTGPAWRWMPSAASSIVPTGSAASDFYGADRVGDDLFANTLLALNAETGERIWHFQAVHHDLWDRDFPVAAHAGHREARRKIDRRRGADHQAGLALSLRSRHRQAAVPHRIHSSYPASTVPGEVAAETQPLPTKPAPYARQLLTEDMLTNRTPEAHAWAAGAIRENCRAPASSFRCSVGQETVIFPGFDGGAEWGGSAFDPETGISTSTPTIWRGPSQPRPRDHRARSSAAPHSIRANCAACHGDDLSGAPPQFLRCSILAASAPRQQIVAIIRQGAGRMPAFPESERGRCRARSPNTS